MEGGHATRRTYRHIVQAEVLVVVPRSGVRLSGQAGVSLRAVKRRMERKEKSYVLSAQAFLKKRCVVIPSAPPSLPPSFPPSLSPYLVP